MPSIMFEYIDLVFSTRPYDHTGRAGRVDGVWLCSLNYVTASYTCLLWDSP